MLESNKLFLQRILQEDGEQTYVETDTEAESPPVDTGLVVGIVLGSIFGCALCVLGVYGIFQCHYYYQRKLNRPMLLEAE